MDVTPTRCLRCGYIVDHLLENRCPECGRPFDPNDRSTFGPPPPNGRATSALILGYVLLAVLMGLSAFTYSYPYTLPEPLDALFVFIWIGVVAMTLGCGGYATVKYRKTGWMLVWLCAALVLFTWLAVPALS